MRKARATRVATALSFFQSEYLAQALKRNLTIATSGFGRVRRTKMGPESRVHPLLVRNRKNSTCERSTSARARTRRDEISWRAEFTRMRTVSPAEIFLTISEYTQGIGANLPGQSVRLCGQTIQVAS